MREQRGEFLRIRDGSQEALIAKRVLLSVQGQSLSLPPSDRGCGHISVSPDKDRATGLSLGGGMSTAGSTQCPQSAGNSVPAELPKVLLGSY